MSQEPVQVVLTESWPEPPLGGSGDSFRVWIRQGALPSLLGTIQRGEDGLFRATPEGGDSWTFQSLTPAVGHLLEEGRPTWIPGEARRARGFTWEMGKLEDLR